MLAVNDGMKTKGARAGDVRIGRLLRARRKVLGLTQTDIGIELGVSFQQVQKYEQGTNRISGARLETLAAALDVPITYFFPEDAVKSTTEFDLVNRFIAADGGARLAKAFLAIKDMECRRQIVRLAEAIGKTAS